MNHKLKFLMITGFCALLFSVGTTAESAGSTGKNAALYDSPAENNPHYRSIIKRIQIHRPTLRAFTQNKSVRAIGKTLTSSGHLLIAPAGVCWSTSAPFPTLMKITTDGIATRRPGKTVHLQRAADSKEIEKLVAILMALFSADEARLSQAFHFFFTGDNSRWTIGFRPSSRALARVIQTVELSGTRDVEKIVIQEANGDISEITISVPEPGTKLSLDTCLE